MSHALPQGKGFSGPPEPSLGKTSAWKEICVRLVGKSRGGCWTQRLRDARDCGGNVHHAPQGLQQSCHGPHRAPTWLKLSRALCRLACIPVGASLVILMEFSRMPWGMTWLSAHGAGSALTKTRKSRWLPSLCCSSFFSRQLSHLATRWMFWQGQRGQGLVSPPVTPPWAEQAPNPSH